MEELNIPAVLEGLKPYNLGPMERVLAAHTGTVQLLLSLYFGSPVDVTLVEQSEEMGEIRRRASLVVRRTGQEACFARSVIPLSANSREVLADVREGLLGIGQIAVKHHIPRAAHQGGQRESYTDIPEVRHAGAGPVLRGHRGLPQGAVPMKLGRGAGRAPTAWYVIPSDRYLARWWNVLHVPYTAWHLSYVALGAALGEALRWDVLGWALMAFFLGLGVAAHALDLLRGDPLALKLPETHLQVVGVASLLLAALIGSLNIYWGNVPWWLGWAIVIGILIALGYNLEWPGFHGDVQFGVFWGMFPFLVGYLAMDGSSILVGILGASFCFLTSLAQRALSARARYLRRRVAKVSLSLWERAESGGDTSYLPQDPLLWLLTPLDRALKFTSFAMPALAMALLLWRL